MDHPAWLEIAGTLAALAGLLRLATGLLSSRAAQRRDRQQPVQLTINVDKAVTVLIVQPAPQPGRSSGQSVL